jgi:membrane protease YdiL (CAAX protease family)
VGPEGLLAAGALRLVGGALVAGLLWSVMGWFPWRAQGWPEPGTSVVGFARGLAVGLAMASAVILIQVVTRTAVFAGTGEPLAAYFDAAGTLVLLLAIAALAEELLFRGFPLARLAATVGPWPAVVGLTIGFTALHLPNPGVSPLGLANVALASVVLSAAFFEWGGLPAAWGLHLGWNAGLGAGADTPVSGIEFDMPGFDYAATGPEWVTGGPFGPEGGVIATVVMSVAAFLLWAPFISRTAKQGKA